jgi:HK97 family phage portal protein
MKVINWVKNLFKKDAVAAEFNEDSSAVDEQRFHLTELALFTAIDFIARSLAKCEFVTVSNNRESRNDEYYLWNYAPNKHQTKIEFFTQAVAKLIFDNELLIIETTDNQLLIADSFSRTEHALIDDSFSGVTCRNFTYQRTFFESEVIYLQYNNFALRGLLADMCDTYEQLMLSAQERYNKAVGHKGILEMDNYSFGDENFAETYNKVLAKQFKAFYANKNAVMPLYKGMHYTEPSTDAGKTTNSEINDIQKLKTEAYTIVGNALHIAPAILSGEASQLSDAMDCAIGNAIDPIANMFEQEITKKRFGGAEFNKGNYLLIDTTTVRHIDAISQANNLDKSIASGVLTPAQAQKYCNMLPCSEAWAHTYYITKNYQTIANALKGGE